MQAKPSARGPVRPGRPLRPVPPRRRPLRRAPRQPRQNQQEVFAMLDQAFEQVYTKFKLHFYQQVFGRFENREATLTTVETFCMEVIMALGNPTVAEFSNLMHLSTRTHPTRSTTWSRKAMWKRCNPAPTSGSITFTRPKNTLSITASATPICSRW